MADPANPYDSSALLRDIQPINEALKPAPGAEYGQILPFAKDASGVRPAMPSMAREGLQGLLDLLAGTKTGNLTPQALQTLLSTGMTGGAFSPAGSVGVFGGQLSKTAPKEALKAAQGMKATEAELWNKTGWTQGPDGKWRYEIPDQAATLSPTKSAQQPLGELLNHPELFAAYPELKDVKVSWVPNLGARGEVTGKNQISIDSRYKDTQWASQILLHEIQHLVQEKEGFSYGANPSPGLAAELKLPENWREDSQNAAVLAQQIRALKGADLKKVKALYSKDVQEMAQELADTKQFDMNELKRIASTPDQEAYRRLAGEVEARNVELRSIYPEDMRKAKSPASTETVPRKDQLVQPEFLRMFREMMKDKSY